jgi:hypothetical protein
MRGRTPGIRQLIVLASALLAAVALVTSGPAGAEEPRLLAELRGVRVDPAWRRVDTFAPNVLMLVQGRARGDGPAESFVAVQYRRITPEVADLRGRLESGRLAPGDRVGVWRVESVRAARAAGGCHRLMLRGGPSESETRRVHQLWCFNPRFALVLLESGSRHLTDQERSRFERAFRRSLLTE